MEDAAGAIRQSLAGWAGRLRGRGVDSGDQSAGRESTWWTSGADVCVAGELTAEIAVSVLNTDQVRQSCGHRSMVAPCNGRLSVHKMAVRSVLFKLTPQRRVNIVISAARRYPISHGACNSGNVSNRPRVSDYAANITWSV